MLCFIIMMMNSQQIENDFLFNFVILLLLQMRVFFSLLSMSERDADTRHSQPSLFRPCNYDLLLRFLIITNLVNLLSVTTSFGKPSPSSSWLTEQNITGSTYNSGLGVTEISCDLEASRTLDIHEGTVRAGDKALDFVHSGLSLKGRIQEIG